MLLLLLLVKVRGCGSRHNGSVALVDESVLHAADSGTALPHLVLVKSSSGLAAAEDPKRTADIHAGRRRAKVHNLVILAWREALLLLLLSLLLAG